MSKEFVMRHLDIEPDAEKLAAMFNASDEAWPGTFTQGVPFTATRIKEWFERQKAREQQIWDNGEEIAGYCSLWDWPDEENVTYIALLNVQPKFHKLGLGRKFLTYYVDNVKDLGSSRLDLHTWSGNLRAMPLYKKTGFFWLPDTQVHMLNFMPAILRMDVAKPFFAKHDWYSSFKRDLSQVEDEERWEGMKVFTYRFEAEGDSLVVWADRESRTITAVETDDLFAAAIAPEISVPGGLPADMTWRFKNKKQVPIDASVIASGTEHLKLEHRSNFQLGPGEDSTIDAKVKVSVDSPEIKRGKPVPAVRSVIVIDGKAIELGTGLRPRRAIEISTHPKHPTITPGRTERIEINLRSRFKKDIDASLTLVPSGLETNWRESPISIAAESRAGLELEVSAATTGVYEIPASIAFEVDGEKIVLPPKLLGVFALAPEGLIGSVVDDEIRIENSQVRMVIPKQGAFVSFTSTITGEQLGTLGGYPVPPTDPSEYWEAEYDLSIESVGPSLVADVSARSKENPGFLFRRRITFGGSPVIKVENFFENQSAVPYRFQMNQWSQRANSNDHVLPLTGGIRSGWGANFPGDVDDDFKKPETYTESWAAAQDKQGVFGIIWGKDVDEISGGGFNLLTRYYECPPASRVEVEPTYLYVGNGDWTDVRNVYRRLLGDKVEADEPVVVPSAALSAEWEPLVPVIVGGEGSFTLNITNSIARKVDGKAQLEMPQGWDSSLTEFDLTELNHMNPFRQDVLVKTTNAPQAVSAKLKVRSSEQDVDIDLPLIRLGDQGRVDVEQREDLFQISNGLLEVDVRGAFGGTVSGLRRSGVEQLASSYPKEGAFGWISPWYGGITPILITGSLQFPGKLWKENFTSTKTSWTDPTGLEWLGVQLASSLTNEDSLGLDVVIDVVTLPSSPVLRYAFTVKNTSSSGRDVTAGPGFFVQPGGSRVGSTLHSEERTLKHSDRYIFGRVGNWAAAENPDTGDVVGIVSSEFVGFMGWGAEGEHMMQFRGFHLAPGESRTMPTYLVSVADLPSFKGFAALSRWGTADV